MAISIPLSYTNATRFILSQMVVEKETKMKEALKILSLRTSAYGLSFFLTQLVFCVFTALLLGAAYIFLKQVSPGWEFEFIICLVVFSIAFISMSISAMDLTW